VAVHIMAAGNQNQRSAFSEGIPDMLGADTAGTHRADDARIGRVGHAANAGGIGSGVRAPIAGEGHHGVHGIIFQHGVNLGVDGLVGKMTHGDSAKFAFGGAGAAAGASRAGDTGHFFFLPGYGRERANACALSAFLAQFFVHHSGDGFDGKFALV